MLNWLLHRSAKRSNEDDIPEDEKERFSNIYLTTVNIIQGVALSMLIQNGFQQYRLQGAAIVPYGIITALSIILVYYQYAWLIAIFRQKQGSLDTIIPVTLGITEAAPSFYLDQPQAWWLATAIFSLIGALAFFYYMNKLAAGSSLNDKELKDAQSALSRDILTSLLATGYCLVMWWLFPRPAWSLAVKSLFLTPLALGWLWMIQVERDFGSKKKGKG